MDKNEVFECAMDEKYEGGWVNDLLMEMLFELPDEQILQSMG